MKKGIDAIRWFPVVTNTRVRESPSHLLLLIGTTGTSLSFDEIIILVACVKNEAAKQKFVALDKNYFGWKNKYLNHNKKVWQR